MVLATGASQPFPMRPKQEWSPAEVEQHLKQMQQDIAGAEKILIIGGGPTGIEMTGVGHIAAATGYQADDILHGSFRKYSVNTPTKKSP